VLVPHHYIMAMHFIRNDVHYLLQQCFKFRTSYAFAQYKYYSDLNHFAITFLSKHKLLGELRRSHSHRLLIHLSFKHAAYDGCGYNGPVPNLSRLPLPLLITLIIAVSALIISVIACSDNISFRIAQNFVDCWSPN
jgi:hypothetical protein